jgi:hypothetical protein
MQNDQQPVVKDWYSTAIAIGTVRAWSEQLIEPNGALIWLT